MNKHFVFILIISFTGLASAFLSAHIDAKKCKKRNGNFPKEGSFCRSFYKCSNFSPIEMKCPGNKHFHPAKALCVTPEEFPCFEKPPKSKECPRANGKFLKPGTNCQKFYDCCDSIPTEKRCPEDLLFNPDKGMCEYPELYTCIEEPISTNCPRPNGRFLKKGTSCKTYYDCENGVGTERRCPDDQLFDRKRETCDWEELVKCDDDQISTECPRPNGKFLKKGSSCTTYYDCRNGVPKERKCSDDQLFNRHREVCEWQELVKCDDDPISTNCPRPNGMFLKKGTSCTTYYDCRNGVSSEKKCPVDQLFDRQHEVCEWRELVKCDDDVTSKSTTTTKFTSTIITSTPTTVITVSDSSEEDSGETSKDYISSTVSDEPSTTTLKSSTFPVSTIDGSEESGESSESSEKQSTTSPSNLKSSTFPISTIDSSEESGESSESSEKQSTISSTTLESSTSSSSIIDSSEESGESSESSEESSTVSTVPSSTTVESFTLSSSTLNEGSSEGSKSSKNEFPSTISDDLTSSTLSKSMTSPTSTLVVDSSEESSKASENEPSSTNFDDLTSLIILESTTLPTSTLVIGTSEESSKSSNNELLLSTISDDLTSTEVVESSTSLTSTLVVDISERTQSPNNEQSSTVSDDLTSVKILELTTLPTVIIDTSEESRKSSTNELSSSVSGDLTSARIVESTTSPNSTPIVDISEESSKSSEDELKSTISYDLTSSGILKLTKPPTSTVDEYSSEKSSKSSASVVPLSSSVQTIEDDSSPKITSEISIDEQSTTGFENKFSSTSSIQPSDPSNTVTSTDKWTDYDYDISTESSTAGSISSRYTYKKTDPTTSTLEVTDPVTLNIFCPEPNGYFPHPTDRHKFIGCVGGNPSIMDCPANLVYVHEKSRCDYDKQ